jgi:hypothetical protein
MEVLIMDAQINYTELLEKEYGLDKMAMNLAEVSRQNGHTDEEIYNFLESFY